MTSLVRFTLVTILMVVCAPVYVQALDFTVPFTSQDVSLELTETLLFDYHSNNYDGLIHNDDYGDIRNRFNLKLLWDDFSVSARLDTTTFFSHSSDASPPYLDRYGPEKLSAHYKGREWQLTLGDHYASFGRSLALRIRKTDELGQDTTLLGAKVRYRSESLEITALAGLSNPTNTETIEEKTIKDPYDLISGLRISYRPTDQVVFSAHGVNLLLDPLGENREAEGQVKMSNIPEQTWISGGSLELFPTDWANFYGEFDWMAKKFDNPDLGGPDGWAGYLAANMFFGNWTLNTEFKSYRDFQMYSVSDSGKYMSERIDYIRPPTLEPEQMEIDNNYDVTGGRIKLDWRPNNGSTLLKVSYSGFVTPNPISSTGSNETTKRHWIYNTNIGVEQDFMRQGLFKLSLGLREDVTLFTMGKDKHLIYLDGTLNIPIALLHSIEIHGSHWWVHTHEPLTGDLAPKTENYLKGEWTLVYSWSPMLSVGGIFGYNTEYSNKQILAEFYTSSDGTSFRQVFMAGTISLNISSKVVIRLLAGQLRGGPKCVHGVCRIFPPFAGVRLETVVRL
jgi:hypothetical protein